MPYIRPEDVISPKVHWKEGHTVLLDTGSGGWSVADGSWDGKPCLGLRWNGIDGEDTIGSPQSRGKPTWWIVPSELEAVIRKEIEVIKNSKTLVSCEIYKPDGYQFGAWVIKAKLDDSIIKKLIKLNVELSFIPPEMDTRRCNADHAYVRANEHGLFSVFIDGYWFGHLYTNGVSEDENKISIQDYKQAFMNEIHKEINKIS
ncbi:hypothetical protein [Providencia rettgeri]|uniref:hypothetical protein n=1 Tax=Providencia rettgeri TaxID=587 RepID=UPI00247FAADA|nr:hypothetical protein [Providencia rettgeri]